MGLDYAVIAAYVLGMVGVGWWGMRRATTRSDYLVAGRRLGWAMYSGTMSAVVLGGASTIGGVALGYQYGLSGAWLVFTIGLGILALSAFFARKIVKLEVYTVAQMLDRRYGGSTSVISGVVMWGYTLMLAVTSTIAYATVFTVLFGLSKVAGVVLGGTIVVLYSVLGGMWSITLTDIAQFVVKTVGILFVLLPVALVAVGGFGGLGTKLPAEYFDLGHIGTGRIVTYLVVYVFGLLIGQDIWQRVFTARSPAVATAGGLTSGLYCLVYAVAGALIGCAAKALYPNLPHPDEAFATIVTGLLPTGLRGLVLAAALAAMMSTASGALIACSTVARNDIWAALRRSASGGVRAERLSTLALGVLIILIAILVDDVVAALTVAYNLLVGGLLVAILGGLVSRRGSTAGAVVSMIAGSVAVVVSMLVYGLDANEPVYFGLLASLLGYVSVSLPRKETP
ncbi:sodium:solute symporter [Kutzneria viridogrisea]|uniref:SSS family solute:Na+ symporter n=1 Tax=Kutzneria viridogrisea TaxID=47990 RepID=A0ABR6BP48_9PSEU|nr:SSS family solute:Na+ symporter [Kutzneria viridogrisea]